MNLNFLIFYLYDEKKVREAFPYHHGFAGFEYQKDWHRDKYFENQIECAYKIKNIRESIFRLQPAQD